MQSPIAALTWEILQRKQRWIWLVAALIVGAAFFNLWVPEDIQRDAASNRATGFAIVVSIANQIAIFTSLLLILAIFSYTELNAQTDAYGFPHRLFVLPVSSLVLVALPILLGVAAIELVYLSWVILAPFGQDGTTQLPLTTLLLGAYMVFYQTILWTFSRLRTIRIIVLGVLAFFLMAVGGMRSFPGDHISDNTLYARIAVAMVASFVAAWMYVTRQRTGGGFRRELLSAAVNGLADRLPRRMRDFTTPSAAHFWFEWRRCGLLLPGCVGGLLLAAVVPLAWYAHDDPSTTFRIPLVAVAMPIVLALSVGKAFSKPDFWSSDLSLPAFVAVRPLANQEIVSIKLKVAAASTAVSWMLVFAFLSMWLPLADRNTFSYIRAALSPIYGQSSYVLMALSLAACLLLTWRFLVNGFWTGLSGNQKLFTATALPFSLIPLELIPMFFLLRRNGSIRTWIRNNPNDALFVLECVLAVAVIAKLCIAFYSRKRLRSYFAIWIAATACVVALAVMLWTGARQVVTLEVYRLRDVLILTSLLAIPLARLGLAPSFLERNRHR